MSPTSSSASTASSMSPTIPSTSTASSKSPTNPSVSTASSMSPTIPSASTAPSMNPTDCDQPPPPIQEESTEIEDPVNIEPVKPCPSYQINFPQEYKIHLLPIPQGVFGQPGVPIQPLFPMVNLNGQAFPFPQRRAPMHIASDSDSDEDQPKPVEDRLGRDERKAREMLIDQHISFKDIIHLPMDEFYERLANTEMNDEQQTECRDIRRRAKNRGLAIHARKRRKAEAQNAQKRKITEDMEREALELEKELQF